MTQLERKPVFTALTRPQMFAGVSYSFFVLNLVITTDVFLITKSFWTILAALLIHAAGYVMCLREPRFLDLWLVRAKNCQRVKNYAFWRCNSYMP
jgi:type IV secretion system protein VirB3